MRKLIIAAMIAGALATPALAQESVMLQSAVFIERLSHTGDGRIARSIEPARTFSHGDRLILLVEWQAQPGDKGFTVTSAIPASIAFEDTSQEGMQVSADGGRHWGTLGSLQLNDHGTTRLASPEDVTHLRWQVNRDEARRGTGRMTYSAIVR